MIIRYEAWKSGKILAVDFENKIYEYCTRYTGRILEGGSVINTTTVKVLGNIDLSNMVKELRYNGFKEQWGNVEGKICLR